MPCSFGRRTRAEYQQILDQARSPEQALEHLIRLGTGEWDAMLANGRDLPAGPELPYDAANIQYTSPQELLRSEPVCPRLWICRDPV